MVAWVQNGGRCVDGGRSPAWSRGSLGRQLAAVLTSITREDHTASSGKDRNSKSEVRFLLDAYWFLTIAKLNNPGSSIPNWDRLYIHAAYASSVAMETYFLLGVMARSVWRTLSWGTEPPPHGRFTSCQAGSQCSPVPSRWLDAGLSGPRAAGWACQVLPAAPTSHERRWSFGGDSGQNETLERVGHLNSTSFVNFYYLSPS